MQICMYMSLNLRPNEEFTRRFQRNLKANGFKIEKDDVKAISVIFLETLIYDFIAKCKSLSFDNFGTFTSQLRRNLYKNKGSKADMRFSLIFKKSPALRNYFKKIYGLEGEETERD